MTCHLFFPNKNTDGNVRCIVLLSLTPLVVAIELCLSQKKQRLESDSSHCTLVDSNVGQTYPVNFWVYKHESLKLLWSPNVTTVRVFCSGKASQEYRKSFKFCNNVRSNSEMSNFGPTTTQGRYGDENTMTMTFLLLLFEDQLNVHPSLYLYFVYTICHRSFQYETKNYLVHVHINS